MTERQSWKWPWPAVIAAIGGVLPCQHTSMACQDAGGCQRAWDTPAAPANQPTAAGTLCWAGSPRPRPAPCAPGAPPGRQRCRPGLGTGGTRRGRALERQRRRRRRGAPGCPIKFAHVSRTLQEAIDTTHMGSDRGTAPEGCHPPSRCSSHSRLCTGRRPLGLSSRKRMPFAACWAAFEWRPCCTVPHASARACPKPTISRISEAVGNPAACLRALEPVQQPGGDGGQLESGLQALGGQ